MTAGATRDGSAPDGTAPDGSAPDGSAPDAGPSLAFLVDYDGTICRVDVLDVMLAEHGRPGWKAIDDLYMDGTIGSRTDLVELLPYLPADPAPLYATAERQQHDETFPAFVERARAVGADLEVVSDGYGFHVGHNLARIGVPDVPIMTARLTWSEAGPTLEFPAGDPACHVCGTCKRRRVLAHQARGRHVAFVGDGMSDRYAAAYADTVFAKDRLVDVCTAAGIPFVPWRDFDDVSAWLAAVVADPGRLEPPRARPFICGAEVWGPGRTTLPPGY
jgi:2-hydroxy-3-keto-5-methylthiopentenyl-1-phosphate phosphatase